MSRERQVIAMRIVDLRAEDEGAIQQSAALLVESFQEDRLSRAAVSAQGV